MVIPDPAERKRLETVKEVIDALGGVMVLSRHFGMHGSAVTTWHTRQGYIPAKFYVAMKRMLARRGYKASHRLWNMVAEPSEAAE
jgi:hypothetical protein